MSACTIQSKNGPQHQNTVKEKSPMTKRCLMISENTNRSLHVYAIISEQNPSNAKLLP